MEYAWYLLGDIDKFRLIIYSNKPMHWDNHRIAKNGQMPDKINVNDKTDKHHTATKCTTKHELC